MFRRLVAYSPSSTQVIRLVRPKLTLIKTKFCISQLGWSPNCTSHVVQGQKTSAENCLVGNFQKRRSRSKAFAKNGLSDHFFAHQTHSIAVWLYIPLVNRDKSRETLTPYDLIGYFYHNGNFTIWGKETPSFFVPSDVSKWLLFRFLPLRDTNVYKTTKKLSEPFLRALFES